jgi:hypothetical protein
LKITFNIDKAIVATHQWPVVPRSGEYVDLARSDGIERFKVVEVSYVAEGAANFKIEIDLKPFSDPSSTITT